jgi:hypothetical protein
MEIIDPGHKYRLHCLDGDLDQTLTFVKRNLPPAKYPGNVSSYPGTTLQEVLRCLIERVQFLDNQESHSINRRIIELLRLSIWLLEVRAAERKGKVISSQELDNIELRPISLEDGHII